MSIEFLQNDFDKVSYLANLLTSRATGLDADSEEYEGLRNELLQTLSFQKYFLYGYAIIET